MKKIRFKCGWFTSQLLFYLPLLLTAKVTCGQELNETAVDVQEESRNTGSLLFPEPASCILRRQEELISCHGIDHLQIVESLSKIKHQFHSKKQVVEGRKLESNGEELDEEDLPYKDEISNKTTGLNTSPTTLPPSDIRELTIFSCDLPKLTASNLQVPTQLEILSVVSSGLEEVRPDALSDHEQSLTRLILAHNFLTALPKALQNLTHLEVLDLSHNEIDHLPEGTLLFNLHRLRQLSLDHNKLGQILGAQARLGLRSPGLSLAVFNLEPLRDSLIQLSLAHNKLSAFPEQFLRPFTRLTSLDLSSNELTDVLPRGFQEMPLLQFLDLSGNHLQEFNPENLTTTLLDLNLRGNPWACTCDTIWMLQSNDGNSSEAGYITPPSCSSPLHLRHRETIFLTEEDICPTEETTKNPKVVFIGDDVDGSLKLAFESLHLMNVTALNHQALVVSWRVDADFYNIKEPSSHSLSWAITIHNTKHNPRLAKVTRMNLDRYRAERPNWKPSESTYAELIQNLEEDKQYTLCIVPVQNGHLFTRQDKCQFATTQEKLDVPRDLSTASPVTTAITTASKVPKGVPLVSKKVYRVETEKVVMVNEERKIVISWNVTIHMNDNHNDHVKREAIMLEPLGWKITYRQFAKDNETDIVLVSRGGEPLQNFTNHYVVEDLEPGTGYTFCFQTLSDLEVRASLKGNNEKTIDMTADEQTNHEPEVVYSSVRGQDLYSRVNSQITSALEDLHISSTINTENAAPTQNTPEYPAVDIPSVIPPVPSFIPQNINHDISANIPPIPNFPRSSAPFNSRPPRPSSQPTDGNFVFTSTGEKIPIPSTSSGSSPFNLPSIVGPRVNFDSSQAQWSSSDHPILKIPRNPQQRITNEYSESDTDTTSEQTFIYDFTTQPTTRKQRFTYVERRKRSILLDTQQSNEESSDSFRVCQEIVTLQEDNIITPVAIASTVSSSTTVIIAIVFCCCCPKRCRRKKSGSGWQGKSVSSSNRKISTISNPTPVNVYSHQTSAINGITLGEDSSDDLKTAPSHSAPNGTQHREAESNGHVTGRSLSVASSNGYLTPLPVSNGAVHNPDRVFSEAKSYLPSQKAYVSSMKDRLLQNHKDQKDFHPGYDIPPTSSIKSLLGYDYPHPTPVNPIGMQSEASGNPEIPTKTQLPSPSSSDSNYNASIPDPQEPESSSRPEINLNIPFNQNKSSDTSKKFNLSKDSDLNKSLEYNYINPSDISSKPRTYIKNAPLKKKHRKYGSPQRLPDERISQSLDLNHESGAQVFTVSPVQSPSHLSHSVPDLATASSNSENTNFKTTIMQPPDMTAAARLNLLIGSQSRDEEPALSSLPTMKLAASPLKSPVPSLSTENSNEVSGYVNFTTPGRQQSKDHYHTWSSSRPSTPRMRPSLGEVVLTGGTLIEVPEGYVVPKPPKPARSVRLLVPGEDKPVAIDRSTRKHDRISVEYSASPTVNRESQSLTIVTSSHPSYNNNNGKSQITHLITPELDDDRITLSTGMAV
ncbi:hypothetical protein SK128_028180 [Halocaridina rubra]|uniref:Uncharacterized protein n=1 Tax=Halocaridina rubra TaxID=373956 RepID=A0AAN8WJR8_HALRR